MFHSATTTIHTAIAHSKADITLFDFFYLLMLGAIKSIPSVEWLVIRLAVWACILVLLFNWLFFRGKSISHSFEKIKLKKKDLEAGLKDSTYFEITIAKNSQTTAFQVQQKILKAFHSIYQDPVEGAHNFGFFFFFQKLWRI